MSDPLPQGAVIGILGGGQLGRMLSVAAARLGYRCHIFEPGDAPAGHVAEKVTQADYADLDAIRAFAASVDIVTYEFENVPTEALDLLAASVPVRPGINALAISQDRIVEKDFLNDLGLATAPYRAVASAQDLKAALATLGTPSILKTRRFGYDGKGQIRIKDAADCDRIWSQMADAPSVLEGFVNFSREVSVIGARGLDGAVACFDPGENVHKDGILATTTVPATLSQSERTDAIILTGRILNALDYVGVLGVELFVTAEGLVVNEIAPRVHNSGHWTQNGCLIDQFEQHVRAITGLPLGDGKRHSNVEMTNLIGDDINALPAHMADGSTAVHLYGKAEARAGRKMGHLNRITGPA